MTSFRDDQTDVVVIVVSVVIAFGDKRDGERGSGDRVCAVFTIVAAVAA